MSGVEFKMKIGNECFQGARMTVTEKGFLPFEGDLYPEEAIDFNDLLYRDIKWRAMKELMSLHPDLVLLIGRK